MSMSPIGFAQRDVECHRATVLTQKAQLEPLYRLYKHFIYPRSELITSHPIKKLRSLSNCSVSQYTLRSNFSIEPPDAKHQYITYV